MAKERAIERKEKKAERAERIYLAEEEQEKKILQQKADAARKVCCVGKCRGSIVVLYELLYLIIHVRISGRRTIQKGRKGI